MRDWESQRERKRERERQREKESNRDREKERKMREERESVSWDLGEGVRRVLYSVYKGEWQKGRGGRDREILY